MSGWLASKKDPLFAASSAHRTLIPSFIPKDNYLSRRRIWDHWLVMRLVMTHPLLFVRSTSSHSIDIFPSSSCPRQTKPFNTWPLFFTGLPPPRYSLNTQTKDTIFVCLLKVQWAGLLCDHKFGCLIVKLPSCRNALVPWILLTSLWLFADGSLKGFLNCVKICNIYTGGLGVFPNQNHYHWLPYILTTRWWYLPAKSSEHWAVSV